MVSQKVRIVKFWYDRELEMKVFGLVQKTALMWDYYMRLPKFIQGNDLMECLAIGLLPHQKFRIPRFIVG